MNGFEKWYESDDAFAYRHKDFDIQVKAAFVAGLRHAAEIALKHKERDDTPTDRQIGAWNVLSDIESEAQKIERGEP